MKTRGLLLVSTVLGALLSAVYWIVLFQAVYALSARDTAPGLPAREAGTTPLLAGVAGFIVYVAIAWVWRALEIRWIVGGRHCA